MKHTIVFRRIAGRELEDAAEYYENHKEGLGIEFLDSVKEVLQRISENPRIYAVEHNDIRAATMHRFPYVVFYRIEEMRVIILGVIHGSRDPSLWKSR
jgi:plasmid stabilization system protein ParE